jgi:hypothetical protein
MIIDQQYIFLKDHFFFINIKNKNKNLFLIHSTPLKKIQK